MDDKSTTGLLNHRGNTSRRLRLAALALSLGALGAASAQLAPARQQTSPPVIGPLANYLAGKAGDSWIFQQPGDTEPWILLLEERARLRGGSTIRWAMSDGSYFVTSLDSSGLRLLETEDLVGTKLRFENPKPMLPAQLEIGAIHESESDYRELVDDLLVAEGKLRAKVEVLGLRPVATPAGKFPDCLGIRFELLRTDASGSGAGVEIELDLAPGLGPVRMKGESFRLSGNQRSARSRLDRSLIEAQVGDRLLAAPRTAQVRR